MTSETQVHPQTLPVGYAIDDYRITSVLGQGGFGITYKATDVTLRRDVALKEYLPRQFAFRDGTGRVHARSQSDQEWFDWGLTRFVDEGRALAMFRHPNIASVIRYIEQNGTAYLVMELEDGMDLEHWLKGRDAPDEARLTNGILVPVLEGLARVHDKGLLHRDIKPDNIFIRRDETPVLIDFGASRAHGPEAASKLTSIISAGYSPFEQYGSGERQGPWSDLYALGGTMYRAISGRPPVDAIARHQGTPMEPAVKVGAGRYSRRFLEAIDRALSLDIAGRPQSAREFLTLLGREPPPAPADPDATVVNFAPAHHRPPRRRRATVVAGTVLVAAVVAGAGYYLLDPVQFAPDAQPGRDASDGSSLPPDAAEPNAGTAEPGAGVQEPESTGSQPVVPDTGPEVADGTERDPEPPPDDALPAQTTDEATDTPPPAAMPDRLSEDRILSGLQVSATERAFRLDQLRGAMLEYTSIKSRFDECQQVGCNELPALLARLRNAQQQRWQPESLPGIEMTVTIQNPRRLPDNPECPFMLDVVETITIRGTKREQVRTYCTSNGFDRVVQDARDVT